MLRDHGIAQRFAHIFVSSEIGFDKPDSKIFEFAAKTIGLAPQQILHVGDSFENDALAARNAGWNSVYLSDGPNADYPEIQTIPKLSDLRI